MLRSCLNSYSAPTMTREEVKKFYAELDGLTEGEIKRRLRANLWKEPDKKRAAEFYLEQREKERHERFTEADRSIQRWILGVAIVAVVIGTLHLIYDLAYK
jgi:hypothetical protein